MAPAASDVKLKKRKQAAANHDVSAGPSTKKPRKEKAPSTPAAPFGSALAQAAAEIVSVTAVQPAQQKNGKKDKSKGKGKAKASEDSEFTVVHASMVVSIPPVFANDPRAGVEEMLDSMLMRYIPALEGVVLAHSNITFPSPNAQIIAECPYAVSRIEFDAMTWSPQPGMKLSGRVNLSSPDHVALLVHRTFNVSIPRHHIPTDHWEFEYGPAANDPEFGAEAAAQEDGAEAEPVVDAGRWKHKLTTDVLGEGDDLVEFTVVGLTVANQMLSLIGSLQSDPFSPDHVPNPSRRETSAEPISRYMHAPAEHVVDEEGEGMDDDEDEEAAEEQDAEEQQAADEAEREKAKRVEEKAAKKARKAEKRKNKEEGREERKKRKKES